ncbi:surface antigen (D15) [Deinococcus proteolyticus MRP]|uniref:Surface antigen (D15) n=1 Tax=Deinococcus proteolyticus (strain ATCC 35074 / DSM 20540 / JCM 6276 / NBRC 101906 / NCIMB 13154 / VKM Ac-1939 / CCM 2703 / MRP) TaxID=693977 RepID=F0RKS1_DEIPM|nr:MULTISPECIES: POTRA domain-containing protein [Deinococcus]ADY26783.1 surface antigen (D15) [Deinococcus proteolyticus MRP]MCY1702913.1 BamA/TamA family outer membrane protein [Deinococcus sp. SL84]
MRTQTLMLTLALSASAPALAQTAAPVQAPAPAAQPAAQPAGTVSEVVVNGTTELLANFVRATLSVQPGTPVASVNLEQVRQSVLNSGYFSAATPRIEQRSGRSVLVVDVVPNATIGTVEATGLTFLSADAFKKSIADLLNIAPGAALNTARLEQARKALLDNYRSEGYPFVPTVNVQTAPANDGTVTVRFLVDETAPIRAVRIQGVSLLERSRVENIFRPLQQAGKFTPEAYYRAVSQVQALYEEAGYLHAGVEVAKTTLEGGLLTVQVVEGRVAALDTSNLGNVDPAVLQSLRTRPGQPVRAEDLQADVRTLANRTGKPVGFALQANPQNLNQVAVYFGSANVVTAPIQRIEIRGNTLIPTEQLRSALTIKEGDVFSPQLAQDNFVRLRDLYRAQGYEISTRDAVQFENGVLALNIREVKLAGYELNWQGDHRTEDRVILRELPKPGGLFNAQELRESLANISRLGYVQLVSQETRVDPQNPEAVTYVLTVAEADTGIPLQLSLGYDSLQGGWNGEVGYSNPNVFGLGHNGAVSLGAQQNDAGQNWFGSASYTIPWLDLDFLDFRENRTSLSASIGSNVGANQTIFQERDDPNGSGKIQQDTGRDFTVRNNSFGVDLSRRLTDELSAGVGVGVTQKTYFLEGKIRDSDVRTPYRVEGDTQYWIDCNNTPVQAKTGDTALIDQLRRPCALTDAQAAALLPEKSLTTSLTGRVNYDSTNSFAFPSEGWRADLNGAYNFGTVGEDRVNWFEVESGARTYFSFGDTVRKASGEETAQQVVAVRANAGTTIGNTPEGTGFRVGGGGSTAFSRQLRGVENGSLFGANYFTTSAEYRRDLNINLGPARGVYGVLFADAGDAWDDNDPFSLNYGVGAGVQLDLGLGGFQLPPLRFDYGYNPQTSNGQFYFRLGNFW